MKRREDIIKYLEGLDFKAAFNGYNKEHVLQVIGDLNSMYKEVLESETDSLKAVIESQKTMLEKKEEALQEQSKIIGKLQVTNQDLQKKNDVLENDARDFDKVRNEYLSKQQALTDFLVNVKNEKIQIIEKTKKESAEIISRARENAQSLLTEYKASCEKEMLDMRKEVDAAKNQKNDAMRQLKILAESILKIADESRVPVKE